MSDNQPVVDGALGENDRRELLRIARASLREWLRSGRTPPGAPHRESLLRPLPAFVSVRVDKALRGCMGHVEPTAPLYKTVVELAVAAATRDTRFAPIGLDELDDVRFSISLLSPLQKVVPPDGIELGRHGLLITRGARRGLLLPQVAVEQRWSAEQFLAETCRKAMLPPEAWRESDATVSVFTADTFSDD